MKTLQTLALVFGVALAFSVQAQNSTVTVLRSIIPKTSDLNAEAEAIGGETVPLTGKLVDATGQPVAGAIVERYEYDRRYVYLPSDLEMRERITTAANGSLELRSAGTFVIVLPFLILAFANMFFGERLKTLLQLEREVPPPFTSPLPAAGLAS